MDNKTQLIEKHKKYMLKQYLIRTGVFIAITAALVLAWSFYVHGYLSEKLNSQISYTILIILIAIAFYKLKILIIVTDRSFSGNVSAIRKKTILRNLHPTNAKSYREVVYEDIYTINIEKNGKTRNKKIVYSNVGYDMPYKNGDSVNYYFGTNFPQFDDCMSDIKNYRKICVWCGTPINSKDVDDELCHFCHKGIIL